MEKEERKNNYFIEVDRYITYLNLKLLVLTRVRHDPDHFQKFELHPRSADRTILDHFTDH